MSRLALLVTQGQDVGSRLALDDVPRIVGRARDADLALTDLGASRPHLEVRSDGVVALVRTLAGAAPFAFDGIPRAEARVPVGGRLSIGATTLAVVDAAPAPRRAEPTAELTDVRRLVGPAGDIAGLGPVYALLEALDRADDRASLDAALARWAATAVGATGAEPLDDDALADPALAGVLRGEIAIAGDRSVRLVVPGEGVVPAVAFALPLGRGDLTATLERLLVVAGRLHASAANALHARSVVAADRGALRAQAVGSARDFLGDSPGARRVAAIVPKLARSDVTALFLGESGVGKTFVARLVHEASPTRAREPLTVLNCAAIPEGLVESELFGHERGAFTGADVARPGALEVAGRGTLLLDEVGELPLASQAKLLHVLEARTFERVGSRRSIPLRARVLAATNRDLARAVETGTFRSDLYFRISVVSVHVPALRERGDDILGLAERLLADLARSAPRRVIGFDAEALALLRAYPWPGNVRELRNAIEHALVLGDGPRVLARDLPQAMHAARRPPPAPGQAVDHAPLPMRLDALEELAIAAALRATNGNRTRAAALLGINRVTLYKKLREPDGER